MCLNKEFYVAFPFSLNTLKMLYCCFLAFYGLLFSLHTGFQQFDHDVLWCNFLHISYTCHFSNFLILGV